jgi:DNA replication and repair protein RecF
LLFARVRAVGWRNLVPLDLRFDPRASMNVLYGKNGQGKTNLIEALYFLGTFRSFRTSQAADLIQSDAAEARVGVELVTRELDRTVEVRLSCEQAGPAAAATVSRAISVDGKPVRRASAAYGLASVVLFVPDDLVLARSPPAARRRFLDMAISGMAPRYLSESATFQRVLRGRNALLRSGRGGGASPAMAMSPATPSSSSAAAWLETIDEQLAQAGARIVMRRRGYLAELAPHAQVFFRALHADLPVRLVYDCDLKVAAAVAEDDVSAALLAGLRERRALDVRRRHTTFGPQTDDLGLHLGGRLAREHASQGQIRSLMLALKLAELALLKAGKGEAPVLLLDDVPSELDPERRQFLFETLSTLGCQTILSVADRAVVPVVPGRADFHVAAGAIVAAPDDQDFALHPLT